MTTHGIRDFDIRKHPEVACLLAASAATVFGALIYLVDRQPNSPITIFRRFTPTELQLFGLFGYSLPSFFHVYIFTSLSFAVFYPWRVMRFPVILFWLFVDSLFEIGQHESVSLIIVSRFPAWFTGQPAYNRTSSYFVNGTFDPMDLLAIALGSIAALLTLFFVRKIQISEVKYESEDFRSEEKKSNKRIPG